MDCHNRTLLFQEKKPMARESKNQMLPTHPHHPIIYPGTSQHSRYSQLSNGYSNGGSVYYPGQRHPDMLPDDEALWLVESDHVTRVLASDWLMTRHRAEEAVDTESSYDAHLWWTITWHEILEILPSPITCQIVNFTILQTTAQPRGKGCKPIWIVLFYI